MKIKCDWCETEYQLQDALDLKSITTKSYGFEARVRLICPGCNQTEYMTLRTDFILVTKPRGEEE